MELQSLQQSRPSHSLKLRDLEQTTNYNYSELETENRALRQRVQELESQ